MDTTEQSMQNPFLVGVHLYLRPLEPEQDKQKFARWVNLEEMRSYFNVYPISETRAEERIDQLYKDFKHILFGVVRKDKNELIGLVGLKDIHILNHSAEFYIKIDPSAQGKGYGTEATRLMLRYGFAELNLHRIQTQDMEENVAGWRTDEKAGFRYEGTLREVIARFGRFHNVRVYSLLRSEFEDK
jgi:RimJ/RimL family protein N-acetyltransferase